jgi:hypothetical protein
MFFVPAFFRLVGLRLRVVACCLLVGSAGQICLFVISSVASLIPQCRSSSAGLFIVAGFYLPQSADGCARLIRFPASQVLRSALWSARQGPVLSLSTPASSPSTQVPLGGFFFFLCSCRYMLVLFLSYRIKRFKFF